MGIGARVECGETRGLALFLLTVGIGVWGLLDVKRQANTIVLSDHDIIGMTWFRIYTTYPFLDMARTSL